MNLTAAFPVAALSSAGAIRPIDGTQPPTAPARDPGQVASFSAFRPSQPGSIAYAGRDSLSVGQPDLAGFQAASVADLGALGLKPSDLTATQGQFAADVFVKTAGDIQHTLVIVRGANTDAQLPSPEAMMKADFLSRQLSRWASGPVSIHLMPSAAALAPAFAKAPASSAPPALRADAAGLSAFDVPPDLLAALQDGGSRLAPALLAAQGSAGR